MYYPLSWLSYELCRKLILSSCSFLPIYKRASLHRWNFLHKTETDPLTRPLHLVSPMIMKDVQNKTCLLWHHNITAYAWVHIQRAPCILTSELRQIWMVSFALHSLYPQEKSPRYTLNSRTLRSQKYLAHGGGFAPWGKQRAYYWQCPRRLIKSWMIWRNTQHAQKWIKCINYSQ